jgi:dihydrofolate reductase
MRKIVATEYVTLDGVMEAPQAWSFDFWSDEAAQFKLDELMGSDALLLGRVTYQEFAAAWPSMTDEAGFADRMNSITKYVVSTTLRNPEWNNSQVISTNVADELSRLKQEPGQDILLSGSADLFTSLVAANLIDEYRLMLHPVVVGRGKRLFREGVGKTALRLVDTKPFESGVVVLFYEPAAGR